MPPTANSAWAAQWRLTLTRLWKNYSLGIVLFALFAVSWVVQTYTGWREFVSEQTTLGATPTIFGDGGYIWTWSRTTFENWESEFLQLFAMVVLTAYLVYKGSTESKDGQEELRQAVDRIERRLDQLAMSETVERGVTPSTGRIGAESLADLHRVEQKRSA